MRGWKVNCWFTAILTLAVAGPARAGDHSAEFVPELNGYIKLDETKRLFLRADLIQGLTEGRTDGELGVHLDITLAPIFRPYLREANWERDRYLWVRIGYQLSGGLDDREASVVEHRGIVEATVRVPLPADVWLVHRGRVDLRDIDGDFSSRLRYRAGLEREVTIGGATAVPYVRAEVFYDTRFGAWNRQLYQTGAEIELSERWRIEPYYRRQEDQRSSPAHVDRIGIVLKFYH